VRSGAAAAAPAAGTRLAGRYLLLDRLGSGGMGVVWRARDELLGREVAIKDLWLPPSATAADRTRLRDRVLGEARAAARFSHPGAVVLHDVLVHDGRPLLVMELVDAPSLHELVEREGPLPTGLVARLGLGLLDTLEAAHRQGVVHLDVTPANVLVLADGGAKLADFGIAAAQDASARRGDGARLARLHGAGAGRRRAGGTGGRPLGAGRDHVLRGGGSVPVRPRRAAGDVGGGRGRPTAPAAAGRSAGSGPARHAGQAAGAAAWHRAAAPAARSPRRRRRHRPVGGGGTGQGGAGPRRRHAAAVRRASGHHQTAPGPGPLARRTRARLARPGHCPAAARPGRHAGPQPLGRVRGRTPRPGRRAAPRRPVPPPRRPREAAWRSATGPSRLPPTTTRSGRPSRS
jgi:Protein kinase domain